MNYISKLMRLTALLAVTALLASPAAGQGFKWWQSDQYRRELGLSADQSKRLEEIFQAAVPMLKVQKKTLDDAETQFEALIEKGTDSAVMEQINHVETARAELSRTRTMMLVRMRKELTKDQWAKFNALQHQAAQARQPARPTDGAAQNRNGK